MKYKNEIVTVKLNDPRLKPIPDELLEGLTKQELIVLLRGEQALRSLMETLLVTAEESIFKFEGQFFRIRRTLYGSRSEKSKKEKPQVKPEKKEAGPIKPRSKTKRLPSERYPDAKIIQEHITAENDPDCKACNSKMVDSGMQEVTEYVTMIPKEAVIVRQYRHKYRCTSCHGDIKTAPAAPRLIPGSSYGDEIIIDATLSKYCDLIPMERYTSILARQGSITIPPQSLIAATIRLAQIYKPIYKEIERQTTENRVLLADETPHRMLEGDEKKNLYLWGFIGGSSAFYRCCDTRSGDVAFDIISQSKCEVLLSDVYSGYKKAVRVAHETRIKENRPTVATAYCNSHARRDFKLSDESLVPEAQVMIDLYRKIYMLEATTKGKSHPEILAIRSEMLPFFENMKEHALVCKNKFSSKSSLGKAFEYFFKYYNELTYFLTDPEVPIDNNATERLLRSPVIGRKTWYGNHSKRGAETAAIHFTLVQSCHLAGVNPRLYYRLARDWILKGDPILTPLEYAKSQKKPPN